MAYSAGFTPHPKISYVGASPTGAASEAEYLEIGLAHEVDVDALRADLDAVLPDGLDIVEAVPAGPGSLPERMHASRWQIAFPGMSLAEVQAALTAFLARDEVGVERMMKSGRKVIDTRAPVVLATACADRDQGHAIIDLVVRQVTPTVRPNDIVAALHTVAGLAPVVPPIAARLAQGPLDGDATVGDPLAADREYATRTL